MIAYQSNEAEIHRSREFNNCKLDLQECLSSLTTQIMIIKLQMQIVIYDKWLQLGPSALHNNGV